jgi:thioredoxin 1
MPIPFVADRDLEREVIRAELPVLVDLYANYPPCHQLTPILEQLDRELSGKLKIVRIDVEKNRELARQFGVRSLPMLVLIVQGRPVDQVVGPVDKKMLLDLVQPYLPAATDEVAPKELQELLKRGQVVPVDVREASAYGRYRIPGAVHIPKETLLTRLAELQPVDGRLRVLYGRTTDDAKDLAEKVRQAGVDVAFLAGGFLHWEADGGEVERGG